MRNFSSALLSTAADWKAKYTAIEPAFQQLVQCYDYSAHLVRAQHSDVAPRLLNELWDEIEDDLPSELDVRAAAVRLFSFDSRVPNWLESQIVSDEEEPQVAQHNGHASVFEAPGVVESLRALHQCVAAEMRCLCELTARMEDMLSEESDEPVPAALDAMLESLASVRADDIRAAAVRLGVAETFHLAW